MWKDDEPDHGRGDPRHVCWCAVSDRCAVA
jgi:hypothetical protein